MTDTWFHAVLFIAAGAMLILGGWVTRRSGSAKLAYAEIGLGVLLLVAGLARLIAAIGTVR